jgi:hypothetical protein
MKPDCKNNKNTQLVQPFQQKAVIHLFGVAIEIDEFLLLVMHSFDQLRKGKVRSGAVPIFVEVVMGTNVDVAVSQTEHAEEHDGGLQLFVFHRVVVEVSLEAYTDADRVVTMDFVVDMRTFFPSRTAFIDLTILPYIIVIPNSSHRWFSIQMPLMYVLDGVRPSPAHMMNDDVFGSSSAPQVFPEFEFGVMDHDGCGLFTIIMAR